MEALLGLALIVLELVAIWKIFVKSGNAGWKMFIPFYNTYIMFKIAWGNGWFFLLMFIPLVNFVVMIMMYVKLAKAFGHGGGFAVGLIFLSIIFLPILAFEDNVYYGPQ